MNGKTALTIGRVSSRVKRHSRGLVPHVAARGSVTWVHVEEDTTKTNFSQQGELWDRQNVRRLKHLMASCIKR